MMNIGLTGGIGCGKSTALAFFKEAGATVVETDAIVRQLLASDAGLIAEIEQSFGSGVIDKEGRVDRSRLGAKVFRNSKALAILESLVHPRVRQQWMRELAKNHPVLIVEIPLLFEKDLQGYFSTTLCVSSYPELQFARLKARGMSESQIQYRKDSQLSLDEKMSRADIILHNNGSPEHLREQVEHTMRLLQR
ncbi:dephospho-CoA kinase [Puniceicoccales bacterium CK1056]|uniref:Dephospho-CoA kinase n=1 Tax=Oceanipulchritudo coccoides TaxID=2706888 RepID=A0A6B2LZB0_9BACT|nr:dephospho-CoA kinase [Oceanipulchritudo coccoides]NDV60870.1 dephospho-CoA kinase [Oceanipulchritudo coccoides]